MRENELIIYRNFDNEEILDDMSRLFEHSREGKIDVTGDRKTLYTCMSRLTELAGKSGFYGNLWHCYLTSLLVNHENSYSMATEITFCRSCPAPPRLPTLSTISRRSSSFLRAFSRSFRVSGIRAASTIPCSRSS